MPYSNEINPDYKPPVIINRTLLPYIHLRPIKNLKSFYDLLTPMHKKKARKVIYDAHKTPKIKLEQEVLRLERASKISNFI